MPQTPSEAREASALEAIASMRTLTPGEFARYMDLAALSFGRVSASDFPDWREYRSSAEVERELAKRTPR